MIKIITNQFLAASIRLLTTFLCTWLISNVSCRIFDYTKIDYCAPELQIPHIKNETNTACRCKHSEDIVEMVDNLLEFRQIMLDHHNYLRQRIASGEEKNASTGSAADMYALSYHLELEHLSRCWLMSRFGLMFGGWHDKVRITKALGNEAGQNLAFSAREFWMTAKENYSQPVQAWYDEVTNLKKYGDKEIDKFTGGNDTQEDQIGHFTAMIWSTAAYVGCARGRKAQLILDRDPSLVEQRVLNYGVICEYSADKPVIPNTKQYINLVESPVYRRGKPCSKCPAKRPCNKKYNALCGEIQPIPTDGLKGLPGGPEFPDPNPEGSGEDGKGGEGGGTPGPGETINGTRSGAVHFQSTMLCLAVTLLTISLQVFMVPFYV